MSGKPMDRFQKLLQRHITHTASAEEEREFLALVKSGKYNHLLDPEIADELRSTQKDLPDADQASIDKIYRKITATPRRQTSRIVELKRPRVWLAAAAVIIAATVIGVMVMRISFVTDKQLALQQETHPVIHKGKQFVQLPDGSTVLLNENSELKFEDSFGVSNREVTLEGEGYFDVAHDATKPFVVHTGKVNTRVLGTAFNIKAYADQAEVSVTVTRGRVQVGDDQRTYAIITPNEQIVVNTSSNEFVQSTIDAQTATSWKNKHFIIDNVTFAQAAALIEERFNVKVIITNESLKDCKVTAWFVNNENLQQIAEGLSVVYQANATIKGNQVIIEGGQGCQ